MYRLISIITIFVLVFTGCGPSVTLIVSAEKNIPVFKIRHRNINNLYSMMIWNNSTTEFYWAIRMSEGNMPDKIVYGAVPEMMIQIYPSGKQAPASFKSGDIIAIEIRYDYDTWMAPSTSTQAGLYVVKDDNTLRHIDGEINYPKKYPKEPDQ